MNLTLLAVGKVKDRHLASLCREFQRRLRRYARIAIVEVRDSRATDPAQSRLEESDALLAKLPQRTGLVALDVEGEQHSSPKLAAWLEARALAGQSRWAFAIGGPFGLSEALLDKARLRLSLSPLTFTHEMARFILLEQLYRAMTIWRGVPYHY